MGEMVASRSMQVLDYLKGKHESAHGLVEGEVKELVATLKKIEKLLNNEKLVKENERKIRNLVYTIEDALEIWGVGVEEAFMPSKNEKKRGITRNLRRCFGRGDEGSGNILYVMLMFVMTYILELVPLIVWFDATFPEDALKSEIDTDRGAKKPIERSLAFGRSLALPRQMYAHGMQEHFVEMKEDLDKLVELVSDQDEKHRVVSICGAKGLGKTSLARRVYIDPKVRNHFNAFAWVHLSRDYQIDGLLQNILNQLDAGVAVKKSADEKKVNPSQIEAVKKSAKEHNKKESAEHMIDVVTEDAEMIEEFIEDAEMIEGAREQKKGTEKRGNPLKSVMRTGSGAVKKSSAAEHKKGAEQKKEGAEEMIEDADEMIEEVTEDAEETIEGAREQKKGTEKRGNPLKSVMKKVAGVVKKSSAAERKKRAEQKKEGAEEMIEGAEDMIDVVTEDAEMIHEFIEDAEMIEGALEQKKGTEKRGNPLKSVMKTGSGAVKKSSAAEHKIGTEQKKEGTEEMIEDAEEMIDVAIEDAEETIEGAREQKKGTEKRGNPLKRAMKTGAGAVKMSSAAEHKKGAEQKKEGAEEMIEGAREQKKGTEKRGNPLQIVTRISSGAGAVKKSSAAEHKKGAEQKKEGAEEQPKSMMDQLKKILREEKCFIVIDGISESSQWNYITSNFLMEGADTRFLLTTEKEEIAGEWFSHKLRRLNEDEGWELLRKYAFRGKKAPDLGLMPRLGKEMVGKCDYLPSAISIIGRILSEKSRLSEWHKVNDDVKIYLQNEAEQSESNESVHNAWDPTCYDRLPYREKQCFFYLAIFKKDEGVDPEDLSFLWMAESMFSPEERTILMEQTKKYVGEFASLLHVQVDELSTNRRFISLPDNMREYYLHMGVKEDFRLKVVDFSGGKQPRFDQYSLSDGIRRLVIHFNKLSSTEERRYLKPTYNNLRSLLFLNSDREYVHLPVTISDFKEFTLLRILHFVRCKFEGRKLPEGIWELLNLRYFGLLYCDLDELPPSITSFRNLQVLNVRSYEDSKIVIPNVISQMVRLKHVRLKHVRLPSNSDHEKSDRLKLDGLHDLETLDGLNADNHDLDSLSKLEKLRDLATHAYSNGSLLSIIKFVKNHGAPIRTNLLIEHQCDFTSQEGMTVLEEVLMSNLNALTFSMVVMPMFPNCGQFASKRLTQMKLIGCKLSADPMEALGKFPNLGELWLAYGAFVGKTIAIGDDGGFPNLKYLEFRCLPNLEKWRVHKEAMKKLSTLIVRKCPKLKGIPDELMASVSSHNNMEIELPLTALAQGWEEIYKKKFGLVKSHSSGGLKDLQVALVKLTKQVDQKNKLPAGTDTGAAGAGTSGWGGVDDTGALMEANGDISMEET